jgi:restriction endonuclease S subunit
MGVEIVRLADVVSHKKKFIIIDDNSEYKRCKVKLHRQGIIVRDVIKGSEINTKKQQVCKEGQLLVAEIDAKVGGYGIVPKELAGAIVSSHYYLFDIHLEKINLSYLEYFLKTDDFFNQIKPQGTTNYASIRPIDVLNISIPLPTLEIQKIIGDKLEITSKSINSFNHKFESNALNILELRQSILHEAVQGKLVPQDHNDEPASELLVKINAGRQNLVIEKKIKKNQTLPRIMEDEIPFDLPMSWEWIRLADITFNHGQKIPNQKFTYIDVGSINKERGIISDQLTILKPDDAPSRARKIVDFGTVIYSTVRPYLLNIAMIDRTFDYEPIVSTAFAVMHPLPQILNKYLYYYLRSRSFVEYVESQMVGMAYPAINESKLFNGLFPLPPINEQKRIVEKIDRLLDLCDELEKMIEQSNRESELLMQSLLQEAFNPTRKEDNVTEFPTSELADSEEEWDMAARADDISPETLLEIANTLDEIIKERK